MCRWLERDPAGYQDGPSLYSYLGRNPMAGTDPYGLFLTNLVEGISYWWHGGKKHSPPQYHKGWRDGKRGRWKHYYVDGEIGATWWIPDYQGGNTWWTETLNAGTQLQRERIDRFQEFRRAGANALAIGAASVVVAGMTLTPGPDELIAGAVLVRVGAGAKLLNGGARFVGPVRVVDRRTGKVFEGPVDLKPTLDRIQRGVRDPHVRDGSIFRNEKGLLPAKPNGYYQEFVHRTPGINHVGPQRVVIGRGGEVYYTPDHYDSFIPVCLPGR